ncbi:uncharacterized protein LOC120015671 [Tripterygium wilfordii]|uniref:uncharacterized protein LOC120015671 n=1 Tax=Tripterygium wilfordii TaxID=458696 RepID=UPI0018F81E15|nr:uncharacterized protein LOC120015671 [Tripterygium wilfordii]XP_038724124.1 uncharacterized protein LOC120015671 [Tripterygium wilfordii]XP_038724125.1 uncharacterized protein LOC120015671 [Tripterygium wilfordii]
MRKNRKTVAELLLLDTNSDAHTKFTCKAKINNIDASNGWWYPSCPTCGTAAKPYGDANLCSICSVFDQPPIPCYILNSTVKDETAQTLFTIFGRQPEKIIGIPATTMTSMKGSDRYVLPQIITDIFPVYHIFQVMLNLNNKNRRSICFKVFNVYHEKMSTKETSEKKDPADKKKEDILSQESRLSNINVGKQFTNFESDIQVHTPQKSRSSTQKRSNQQIKLADADESIFDNELISASLQRKVDRKKRGTLTITEPPQDMKKQKEASIDSKKKGKRPAKLGLDGVCKIESSSDNTMKKINDIDEIHNHELQTSKTSKVPKSSSFLDKVSSFFFL